MPKLRPLFSFAAVLAAALMPFAAAQAQENDTLAKIKASGSITFGYRDSSFGNNPRPVTSEDTNALYKLAL